MARQQFLSPLDKRISRPNSFQLLPKYCILLDQNIFTAIERRDYQPDQFYDAITTRKGQMTGPADSHRIIRHNLRLACLTIAARRKSFSVLPNYTSPEFKILAENALECDVRKVFLASLAFGTRVSVSIATTSGVFPPKFAFLLFLTVMITVFKVFWRRYSNHAKNGLIAIIS